MTWVELLVFGLFFFFFKQKTAYEILRSDWSSDVCSSDLDQAGGERVALLRIDAQPGQVGGRLIDGGSECIRQPGVDADADHDVARAIHAALQFDQQAAELGAVDDQVVGPLESGASDTDALQRFGTGQAGDQAQRAQPRQAYFEADAETQRQATAGRGDPAPAAPAASRLLP